MEEARAGAGEGLVAVAEHQTAGRGRLGRQWVAPPGASLLMSILLRPALEPERLHLVTAAVALAAAEAVQVAAGFRPGLKWPNDLVVSAPEGDRKLAGVLAEAALPAVVVGIGINVSWPPELPAELAAIATAANHVAGRPVDREVVLGALLAGLDGRYGRWEEVAVEHRACCVTIGRDVRVELAGETFHGRAVDVSEDGHLVVDPGNGPLRTVSAGDVIHLRPQ